MSEINKFLLSNNIRIADNPCISPDFCLDWEGLQDDLKADEQITVYSKSQFNTSHGSWSLVENKSGDHAWILTGKQTSSEILSDGISCGDEKAAYPASWENLLILKNLIQDGNPDSTIFPTASGSLKSSSLAATK